MKKIICVISTFLLSLVLFQGLKPTAAQAYTWHSGTPKTLRGTYQYKKENPALGFGTIFRIKATYFEFSSSGMPAMHIVHPKYAKMGRYYALKGHGVKSAMYPGGSEKVVVYRHGNRIKAVDYLQFKRHGFKNVRSAKKVTRPKF